MDRKLQFPIPNFPVGGRRPSRPQGNPLPRDGEQISVRTALKRRALELEAMFEGTSKHTWLSEYREALQNCMEAYGKIRQERWEYKRQSVVLEAYYQKNKLLDYLQLLADFAEAEPRPTDTAEKLAVKGYSNYLFVIRHTLSDMKKKYEQFPEQEAAEELRVRDFLKQESDGQPILEKWQQLRPSLADAIYDSAANRQVCMRLLSELDELELSFKVDVEKVAEFLREKRQALLQRQESVNSEIQKGKELYLALLQLLPEELFAQFDPDEPDDWNKSIEQVKEEYRQLASEVRQLLTTFPRE